MSKIFRLVAYRDTSVAKEPVWRVWGSVFFVFIQDARIYINDSSWYSFIELKSFNLVLHANYILPEENNLAALILYSLLGICDAWWYKVFLFLLRIKLHVADQLIACQGSINWSNKLSNGWWGTVTKLEHLSNWCIVMYTFRLAVDLSMDV